MPDKPNNPFQFWQELKRRKVFRVIAMYAATAFIIMEAGDIMLPRLGLPDWTVTFIIVLLIIGFPISIILSWIFDLTPEGVVKTESVKVAKQKETPLIPQKRKPGVSDVIIAVLIVVVVVMAYPKIFKKDNFKDIRDDDGRISVAVMPFQNMTGDTLYNIWEMGLQTNLISRLSYSEELSVRQFQTMYDIFETGGHVNKASITPSVESEIASKLESNTYISGNLMKYGNKIRVIATLKYSETNEIYESFEIDGNSEDDFFEIIDSLSFLIRNHLEIKALGQDAMYDEKLYANTRSPEAYRFFLRGLNRFFDSDYSSAIDLFSMTIIEDTTFVNGKLFLAVAYYNDGKLDKSIQIFNELYENINNLPYLEQLGIKYWVAHFDKNPQECIRITSLMLDYDGQQRGVWFNLGVVYSFLHQYDEAAAAYEKALELDKKWGGNWKWWPFYRNLGRVYHITGQHSKEKEIYELGLSVSPDNSRIIYRQAICALSQGEITMANEYLDSYISIREENGVSRAAINSSLGSIYSSANILDKAEQYYRQALDLEPDNRIVMNNLAYLLIENDINIEEGLELVNHALVLRPENYDYLHTKGWGLYKSGMHEESLELLEKAWDLRPFYYHEHFLLIQEVKQALASQNQ